ncbi:MAG: mycothione reductase [Acidimicrobiia bacterium]|nr:mycothione reductase [Acidimicrobiia bacterium]
MEQFDLIIVGTGSGNAIPSDFGDWRIALVERDVFGGTCLNRGCIPSKMFVYAADMAATPEESARLGVELKVESVDWPSIVKRVFGRIDPIAAGGEDYRKNGSPNITIFPHEGRLVGERVLEVGGHRLTAPQMLLAAGSRPSVPAIPGLADVPFHTSDTIMRLPELPRRVVILGGGYIACELGHVFGSLGSEVAFVLRGPGMLRAEDEEISVRATEAYSRRFRAVTNATNMVVGEGGGGVVVSGVSEGRRFTAVGDVLLVATGRTANGDQLGAEVAGVATDASGTRVLSDATMATNVPGVWALGDLTNLEQLKHLANAEARVAFRNIITTGKAGPGPGEWPPCGPDFQRIDRRFVPHAVFGHPQVASVGMRERDVREQEIPYVVKVQNYGDTAYGWAMEDTTSVCKLIAHAETRQLLGAHLIGPQASILIQPLIQGMYFGQTVDEMARAVWYIHPALSEVVENALLGL